MKKILGMMVFLCLLLSIKTPVANAQTSQNVIVSCLNPTVINDGNHLPGVIEVGGVLFYHVVGLKNKEVGVFVPNQPVYLIRSLPRVICNPEDGDPNCIKDDPVRKTPCLQEKMGSNLCNEDNPLGTEACTPNNHGPGTTVCWMDSYSKQGPYWECAKDKDGAVVCPQSILETSQQGGIHVAENGHAETGWGSDLTIISANKEELLADSEGNFSLEHVQSMTWAGLDHAFYGMQILSDQAFDDPEAFNNSLKLALFAKIEEAEPSATNCTTVWWDPYGRVIDALRLEPVSDVIMLLQNQTLGGQIVNTTLANNPTFRNPEVTDIAGNFNFAVPPGIYFLTPSHADFIFPTESPVLDSALAALSVFDPNQIYFARDKIYNNSLEPITEQAGYSERRDLILTPKDPNYQGSTPTIIYAENLRDGTNQLIRGRVTHPKSVVRVLIGNTLVGQAEADLNGAFSLLIPETVINSNQGYFQLLAEKVPLLTATRGLPVKTNWLTSLVKSVFAQTNNISRPYALSLVPVRLTGFVFDIALQVKPNSVVELTIPSLGGITFAQTKADADGYIDMGPKNLPPFEFVLTVRDSNQPTQNYQLTVEDFKKTNVVYLSETQTNLYHFKTTTKPGEATVAKIKNETPRQVSTTNLFPSPNPEKTANNPSQNNAFVLVFILFLVMIAFAAVMIIRKGRNHSGIYY